MTYRTEFPDFPEADMPAIPQGFVDESWKNDACPHFVSRELSVEVWVDYADAEKSEFPEIRALTPTRFTLNRIVVDADGSFEVAAEPWILAISDDWNDILAAILGEAFVVVLRSQLIAQELAEVRRRNASPEYADACATHDFLDANMSMLQAFEVLFGREPAFLQGTDEKGNHNPEQEADIALWNAAWGHAKKAHLTEIKEVAHG